MRRLGGYRARQASSMNTVSSMNLDMMPEFRDYRNKVDLKEMTESESSLSTETFHDSNNIIHIDPSLYG